MFGEVLEPVAVAQSRVFPKDLDQVQLVENLVQGISCSNIKMAHMNTYKATFT